MSPRCKTSVPRSKSSDGAPRRPSSAGLFRTAPLASDTPHHRPHPQHGAAQAGALNPIMTTNGITRRCPSLPLPPLNSHRRSGSHCPLCPNHHHWSMAPSRGWFASIIHARGNLRNAQSHHVIAASAQVQNHTACVCRSVRHRNGQRCSDDVRRCVACGAFCDKGHCDREQVRDLAAPERDDGALRHLDSPEGSGQPQLKFQGARCRHSSRLRAAGVLCVPFVPNGHATTAAVDSAATLMDRGGSE